MSFTDAQQNAIDARGRTLLVSAAAGSGKTYTLTHRIIKAITEENRSIDRMLIVTFTRAAAGELKAKISKAITDAIAENPDNAHLQEQLLKLGSANISTIDSFFSAPIRANFEKLGLPASLRLADEAELSPVRDSLMKASLDLFFSKHSAIEEGTLTDVGHRSTYTDLLGLISGARDSSALIPTLLKIHRKLITSPRGMDQLADHAKRMAAAAEHDFFESDEGRTIRDEVASTLEFAILRLKSGIGQMQEQIALLTEEYANNPPEEKVDGKKKKKKDIPEEDVGVPPVALGLKRKYIPDFEDDLTRCTLLLKALKQGYGEALAAFSVPKPFKDITRLTNDEKGEIPDRFKAMRKSIVEPLKALSAKYFFKTPEEAAEQLRTASELCSVLCALLTDFDLRYAEEKLKKGVCEFSDMPKFMLKLLQNEDGSPSALADAMAKDFDEVYIDEYQDVNEIQDRIFALIGRDHRFMVGDIKQSIYGFREAEPSIFASYRRRFPAYDKEHPEITSPDRGNSIFMSENFRCDKTVVDFSNLVCSTVFSAFAESIGYEKKDDLIFKKTIEDEHYRPTRVVLNLIEEAPEKSDEADDEAEVSEVPSAEEKTSATEPDSAESTAKSAEDEERFYDEAIVTANEIARLIRDPNEKKADGSRFQAGDIAILVRSHALARPLTEALTRLNIPYVTSSKTALFESQDMKLLSDLLTVVDNPRNDVPLCRLLTAEREGIPPLMTLDEVIGLRKAADGAGSLYDALLSYGETNGAEELTARCRSFTALLSRLRHASAKLPVDKLLRVISQSDRYAPLCDSDAYTYLYNCACKYVRQAWNGLYSFLTYFKKLLEKGESGVEPVKAGANEVRIMTIHQSKGLEFPACFLFGLAKQFNLLDTREPLIFSRAFGLSMKLPPAVCGQLGPFERIRRRKEDTLLNRAAVLRLQKDLAEEEARIFYVALTRARERLYLSGTLKGSYADRVKTLREIPELTHAVKHGVSYLDWTLLPLVNEEEESETYTVRLFQTGQNTLCDPIGKADLGDSFSVFSEEDKLLAAELLRPHGESEEEKLLATIPAKVAASKVSPSMLDDSVFTPVPTGKLFSESDEDRGEAENETAKHVQNRIHLMRSRKQDFDSLLAENQKPTAAEKGTAAHLFLQYCDYENAAKHGVEQEIARLKQARFISSRTAEIIDRRQLAGFFESELFAHVSSARQIRREFRFGMFKSAADFTRKPQLKSLVAEKKIFVQGSIDLLIETENGEILLCDYKTDRVSPEEKANPALLREHMLEKHGEQLDQYRYAVEQIFGKSPAKVFIYSLPLGQLLLL